MKIEFDGIDRLARELQRLNSVRFDGICKKQLTEMLDRARNGGTPVDTGQLRNSSRSDGKNEMGYSAEYAFRLCGAYKTGQKRQKLSLRVV